MNNNMKRKKSGIVISVILFLFSAVSLIYGIYMVRYSLSYVNTYTGMSAVPADKVMQYVVSASSIYFGFGVLFAACAIIILFLSGTSRRIADSAPADIDEHPENNPYYTAPADFGSPASAEADPEATADSVPPVAADPGYTTEPKAHIPVDFEFPVTPEAPAEAVHTYEAAQSDTGIPEIEVPEQPEADVHEDQIWQEAELHQVAAFEEHVELSRSEDVPQDAAPVPTEALQQDAASSHTEALQQGTEPVHTEETPQNDAIPAEAETPQQNTIPAGPETPQQDAAPADHEYHIRPELASDSWLKDAFIKK